MNVLGLSNVYKVRPSTLLDITDPYTAYCLDEACTYMIGEVEKGEEPQFRKRYSSFKDMYAQYE